MIFLGVYLYTVYINGIEVNMRETPLVRRGRALSVTPQVALNHFVITILMMAGVLMSSLKLKYVLSGATIPIAQSLHAIGRRISTLTVQSIPTVAVSTVASIALPDLRTLIWGTRRV